MWPALDMRSTTGSGVVGATVDAAWSSAENESCADNARSSVLASSRPSTAHTRARVCAVYSSTATATVIRLATRTLPSSGNTSS
jgi:hypothetical protein